MSVHLGIFFGTFEILSVKNEPTQCHIVPKYYTITHVSDGKIQPISGLGFLISPCCQQEYRH